MNCKDQLMLQKISLKLDCWKGKVKLRETLFYKEIKTINNLMKTMQFNY